MLCFRTIPGHLAGITCTKMSTLTMEFIFQNIKIRLTVQFRTAEVASTETSAKFSGAGGAVVEESQQRST